MYTWILIAAIASVIQERQHTLDHELTLSLGSAPDDPFQKGWFAELGYTLHFDDTYSWEAVNAGVAYLTSTSLKDRLIETFGRRAEDFSAPRAWATTGFVISPLYGKFAFLDSELIHHALFAGLHAGVICGSRPAIADTLRDLRPAVGLGVGWRVFTGASTSLRIEVRDLLSFRSGSVDQVVLVSIALSLSTERS